jgi:hypothetical protein
LTFIFEKETYEEMYDGDEKRILASALSWGDEVWVFMIRKVVVAPALTSLRENQMSEM